MLACTKESLGPVQLLVEHGASLSLSNKDGWTPLHIACRQPNAEIVRYLLDREPECWNTASKNGRTPLHTAGGKTVPSPSFHSQPVFCFFFQLFMADS